MNEPFKYVCKCGTTHTLDGDKLEKIFEKGKDVLVICGMCSNATIIYADAEPDYWSDKNGYIPHVFDFEDIIKRVPDYDGKDIAEIMWSDGLHRQNTIKKVPKRH